MKRKIALVLALTFALSIPAFAITKAPSKSVKNATIALGLNQNIKTGKFSGIITEIKGDQITVSATNKKSVYQVITFNIGKNTIIKKCKLSDLKVGAEINVVHSLAMTRSLPPQAAALSITLTKKAEETLKYKGKITEVNKDKNYTLITVKTEDENSNFDMIVFTISENTKLDECALGDLRVGATVKVKYGPVMTMSLPPMTNAYEVELED